MTPFAEPFAPRGPIPLTVRFKDDITEYAFDADPLPLGACAPDGIAEKLIRYCTRNRVSALFGTLIIDDERIRCSVMTDAVAWIDRRQAERDAEDEGSKVNV